MQGDRLGQSAPAKRSVGGPGVCETCGRGSKPMGSHFGVFGGEFTTHVWSGF